MKSAGLEDVGRTIKKRRKELGLSQDALAQKAGVTQAQISGMERGANIRTATTLAVLRALSLEMILAPREFVPVIEALVEGGTLSDNDEKPLYAINEEDD